MSKIIGLDYSLYIHYMKAIDLCQTNDPELWKQFGEVVSEALTGGDRNARNYDGLLNKVRDHDCFHVLVDEQGVAGFAGMYNNGIYPDTTARVLNRAYYARRIRRDGLPTNKDSRAVGGQFARYVLPEQIRIAKDLGYVSVFFSVEFNRRRRTIDTLAKWINKYERIYQEEWVALEDMYFTCPDYGNCRNTMTCWQNVAVLSFYSDNLFPLESITRDEWIRRFGNGR